ncbi:MAG: S24/S26 family peptidase [Actinomycetota bacterium]
MRATAEERSATLAGDELLDSPSVSATHAVTVDAAPTVVWPWIVQMGAGRGGWYSYDRIDNGGRPSAETILPEHQELRPGDVVPGLPDRTDVFVAAQVAPDRHLVLTAPRRDGTPGATWAVILRPIDDGTRIIVRMRLGPAPLRLPAAVVRLLFEPAHLVMQRRQLHGIARRVAWSRPAGSHPHPSAALLRARSTAPGGLQLHAAGSSMLPTIAAGTSVDVEAQPRPRSGEIWAFVTDDGQVVVHRHVRPGREGHTFRGDANEHTDAPVRPDQLVGRVDLGPVDRLRGLRRIADRGLRRRITRS